MTLSPSIFRNFGALSMALLYTIMTFGMTVAPTAVQARGQAIYYTAELAAPTEESRVIANGVVWRCAGTKCRAPKANSRPINVCKRLVREVGAVASFTAKGAALTDEKLAKCNG